MAEPKNHTAIAALAARSQSEWMEARRIRDLPEVDDAIRNFLIDSAGDNATCMVRAVMRALGVQGTSGGPSNG